MNKIERNYSDITFICSMVGEWQEFVFLLEGKGIYHCKGNKCLILQYGFLLSTYALSMYPKFCLLLLVMRFPVSCAATTQLAGFCSILFINRIMKGIVWIIKQLLLLTMQVQESTFRFYAELVGLLVRKAPLICKLSTLDAEINEMQ